MLDAEPICPMCDEELTAGDLRPIPPNEQIAYLKSISLGNIDEAPTDPQKPNK
jgi:hypothetical protein